MTILREFKTFIQRGNVMDMAVGIIMGTAFTKIVHSLVNDVLMPPLGFLMAGIHVGDLMLPLGSEETVVNIHYGRFLQTVVDFVIVALAVFALVKLVNALKAPLPLPVPLPWGPPSAPQIGPGPGSPSGSAPSAAPSPPPASSLPEAPSEIQLLAEIRDLLKSQHRGS